jgi:zinc resistance-associated protein
MWKSVLAATAAVAIAGSSLVYAQQRNHDSAAGPDAPRHWRPSAEDIGAFTDARVAALKAGLKLTADQEKNWPAFEQAYREMAKLRADRMRERFEQRGDNRRGDDQRGDNRRADDQRADNQRADNVNPIDRMQRRAEAMTTRGSALKRLADASGPLYQSLDDGQKHRFLMLSRPMGPRHHEHFAFWHMMHRGEGEQQQ